MPSTAKLVIRSGNQLVCLPAEFQFEGRTEVYIRRDQNTGDVILSERTAVDWGSFVRLRDSIGPVEHPVRPREQDVNRRDPFERGEKG